MPTPLRWGILGTGNIARQFTDALMACGEAPGPVSAVASRDPERASAFIEQHGPSAAATDYEGLLQREDVDAIYLALPNNAHADWAVRALEAGKHVLCEKPVAANAAEAERMFEAAERSGRLLVEAFMYRCHPLTEAVLQRVREGAIGELRLVRASFCYATKRIEGNTRFDPTLAGGALMDIGCYCLDLARMAVGAEPASATAVAALHEHGVDERASGVLRFPGDALATFSCGMTVQTENTAYLCGDQGYIAIPIPWKPPRESAEYRIKGMTPPRMDGQKSADPQEQTHHVDSALPLFAQEASAFAAAVAGDRTPAVSPAESIANMRLLDDLRNQVGVPVPRKGT